MGRLKIETAPAKTMRMDTTEARMGLSMKKRLSMVDLHYFPEDGAAFSEA